MLGLGGEDEGGGDEGGRDGQDPGAFAEAFVLRVGWR